MMKVAELEGAQLDWAVARALGYTAMFCLDEGKPICCVEESDFDGLDDWVGDGWAFTPSVYWNVGGPIIEREQINLTSHSDGWSAGFAQFQHGPTPLIAAMRAFVASKFGEEIDLPT